MLNIICSTMIYNHCTIYALLVMFYPSALFYALVLKICFITECVLTDCYLVH